MIASCSIAFGQDPAPPVPPPVPPVAPPPAPEPPPAKAPTPADAAKLAEIQVEWVASFPEALRLARETQKPIFVAFNMDDEVANDAMAKDVYHEKKLVEKSRQFVCVIASVFKHAEAANAAGANECARFGRIGCDEHKACEIRAREALLGGTDVIAPQHLVCTPDGRVLARRAWQMSRDELIAWLDRALKAAGRASDLSPADLKSEKARIAALFEQAEKARSWKKSEFVRQIAELDDELARDSLATYTLKGKDEETRVAILESYGVSGEYTALDVLRKVARDTHAYVALAAVDAMGRTKLPDVKEDLKKLLGAFSAGNDYGRVLRAWAACGKDDKDVREVVLKKAKGTDQAVRSHAIVALGLLAPAPEIEEYLKKSVDDRITVARAAAVWAAGMGRYKNCRKELERIATTESVADLKELALAALAHLDHDPANKECCSLSGKISSFVTLGDNRR